MKYAIIIPDGAADQPLEALDGRTAFEAARTPNLDKLGAMGRQGVVHTTPEGTPCGSDVCSLCLLGYDPRTYHRGRAPLEARAMGLEMTADDWVFRVNLITAIDGVIQDHSAGQIRSGEGEWLLRDLADRIDLPGMRVYPGVSYRNILVDSGGRDWSRVETTPPHDVPGEPLRRWLPRGEGPVELLHQLIAASEACFRDHEVNAARRDAGELPATHVWPWGEGQRPSTPAFEHRFGLRGAMITAVDLLAGIAGFIGWDRLEAPGQTSYHDTDYESAGAVAIEALKGYDLVCVHVEAPDEASHAGDAATKVASIESIDQWIVGPLSEAVMRSEDGGRVLVLPDHYTLVSTRKHDATPPPFVMAGQGVANPRPGPFSEAQAGRAGLTIRRGHELMEYFLSGGSS